MIPKMPIKSAFKLRPEIAANATNPLMPDNAPPGSPPRPTLHQTATTLGLTIGQLFRLSSKGTKHYDPSCPVISKGTCDAAAVAAYKKLRDERATESAIATEPPPVATSPSRDRRATPDRRAK